MAPYYELVCRELNWPVEQAKLDEMRAANKEELERLERALEEAEKNEGETEMRDLQLKRAHYLTRIGDKVRLDVNVIDKARALNRMNLSMNVHIVRSFHHRAPSYCRLVAVKMCCLRLILI